MPAFAATRKSLTPDEIRVKIEDAQTKRAVLIDQQIELAAASLNSEEASKQYHACTTQITAIDAEIERLQTAVGSLNAKAEEATRKELLAEQAAHRDRVGKILDRRFEVAKDLEAAITNTVKMFRELLTVSHEAYTTFQLVAPTPDGAALGDVELSRMVGHELFRQGHVAPTTGGSSDGRQFPSLPGPITPGFDVYSNPAATRPLSDAIAEANGLARSVMEGKRRV